MSQGIVRGVAIGATCAVAGSLAFGFHAQNGATAAEKDAAAWRAEAEGWQTTAEQAVANERRVRKERRKLVSAYNELVRDTRRSNARLLAAVRTASAVKTVRLPQEIVYRTVSTGGSSAASADPAPTPVAAQPAQPATQTS